MHRIIVILCICQNGQLSTFILKPGIFLSDYFSEHIQELCIQDTLHGTTSVYPFIFRDARHTEGKLTAFKITQ